MLLCGNVTPCSFLQINAVSKEDIAPNKRGEGVHIFKYAEI